ncbi:MAG: peptidoglycan DD-metalloendopeptidase family protein [Chloroflexi bacterium]|nr:peptidoglycan DD-metalloendopeptidase family protein [Chloroflexota bacterium]
MTYRQIAKAYAAAKSNFNAVLNKAKEMGLGDEEAAKLKADVAASGTIGASLGAAQGYIVQKQAEQEAQAAAKRKELEAQRAEKKEAMLEPPTQPTRQASGCDEVEALRASNAAANSQASNSQPWWQSAFEAVTTNAQKSTGTAITPVLNMAIQRPNGNPPPTQTSDPDNGDLLNWLVSLWNGLFKKSGSQPTPTPTLNPTTVNQALQTLVAPFTKTAQAKSTTAPISQPTFTPTPLNTPVPLKTQMVVLADGLNLRLQPSITARVLASIPKGGITYIEPNSESVVREGYCWYQVTYKDPTINAKAIAASSNFLNPLSDFYRFTAQEDPIAYNNAVPGWNGKHIGNDFVPAGTAVEPPIHASAIGVVIRAGSEMAGYGNYVIIEYPSSSLPPPIQTLPEYKPNSSLYAIYAHLKENMSNILMPGTTVTPGTEIGTMGASGDTTGGFVHLHLELRLGEAATDSNGLKNLNANNGKWYNAGTLPPLDPALIFTPKDTWTGWAAQSQWNAQAQCATSNPYFDVP